jgi:hypothetical protein
MLRAAQHPSSWQSRGCTGVRVALHERMKLAIALACLVTACGTDAEVPDPMSPPPPPPASSPRYYEDVAPIFVKHCAGCHRDGGAAPFSLVTYDDADSAPGSLPDKVKTRQMPPYAADDSGSCNTFEGARYLTDAEIATVTAWYSGSRDPGDPADAPALPDLPPGLPRVDATVAMSTAYVPTPALPNDYRCFVIDGNVAADSYLTGLQVRPGTPQVVHHILLFQLADAAAETTAENLDAQDPLPGYACFGGPGANANLLGVWAPGIRATTYPADTGLPVKTGRKFVMQVHYHDTTAPMSDQTSIDLMLATTVPNPAFLVLLPDTNLYLPPGMPAVTTTAELTLPSWIGNYNVWGVFPHMHTLGRQMRVEYDHAGRTACMIDVPRWDFNWQQGYFYDGPPLVVGGGDTLRIACTYDTTSRTTATMWGEGTEDEMCLAFAYASTD